MLCLCLCAAWQHRGKSSPPGADLTLILVVDKPSCELSERQALWLQQLQARWLHRVRIRVNEENLGASATRNRALEVPPDLP